MRILLTAGAAALALFTADAAAAQRMVAHGPGGVHPGVPGGVRPTPGYRPGTGFRPNPGWNGHGGGRWGSKVGGHWWAGMNAPGGWNAYRRPYRGWALPRYWVSPQFYISDWSNYGLSQPPYGYNWARYYDDAVLIDGRGSVYDSIDGIDWDRYDGGYAYDDGGYAQSGVTYAQPGYAQPGVSYAQPDGGYYADDRVYSAPANGGYYERRDNGVGGAIAGAAVGGVAGNLIAGRGNRLGGTLIGAGVGALAGYAIDKNEDRHRRVPVAPAYAPPPPAYGAGYAAPAPAYAPPPPPRPYPPAYRGGPVGGWTSPDGNTTVVTTSSGGYYGAGTTTVTVQSAPVVTTTTTEIYEDAVTYSPKKVYRKRVWRPKPKCGC